MIDLKKKNDKEVISGMIKEFGYKNIMAVPRIEKVVINVGFGKEISGKGSDEQKKFIESLSNDLSSICGQKLVLTKAKKSISGFKLREGTPMGLKATLRGRKMYDFLGRLISIGLPRSRDFSGIDIGSFDQSGNLNIGIKEHIIFTEVSVEKSKNIFGFEIAVKTTAQTKEEGVGLLRLMGFPIKK